MSILLFILVLFVLVLVHEWGHFIVAKKTGMRVDEFGIGFPPKAVSFKRGETEYSLNWLPIGGFVRIWGENLEEAEQLSDQAADTSRAFSARPKWAQAAVLIAGVAMNVIFAWLLLVLTFMIGVPQTVSEIEASSQAELIVAGTLADSPASVLPPGVVITSVDSDGAVIDRLTPEGFREFVAAVAPSPIMVSYEGPAGADTVSLVPEQGLQAAEPERYIVGVSLSLVETQSTHLGAALLAGTTRTIDILVGIVVGVYTLIVESFAGTADYSQIAGPVGIVNMVGDAASFGLTALMTFTAVISLNLAVINLLPIPALDGGRLVFVAIEAISGRHIPAVWATRVNLVGFVFLMLLMIAVTYNDIIRLF
jgi:regulator of sigma E protease